MDQSQTTRKDSVNHKNIKQNNGPAINSRPRWPRIGAASSVVDSRDDAIFSGGKLRPNQQSLGLSEWLIKRI